MKKSLIISFALIFLLSVSFVSAGWFSDLFTGKAIREVTFDDTEKLPSLEDSDIKISSVTLKEGTKVELEGGYEISQPYVTEESVRIVVKDQDGESERITVERGESATLSGGETITIRDARYGGFFGRDEVVIVEESQPISVEEIKPTPFETISPEELGEGGAIDFNSNLLELNDKYSETSGFLFRQKRNVLNELKEMAMERKENMIELAKENPILFLNNMMSDEQRDLLSDKIKENVEEEKIIEGNLLTLHFDDFTDPNNPISSFEYSIITKDNEKINFYPITPLGFISDVKIKVSGFKIEENIVGFIKEVKIKEEKDRSITGGITGKAIQPPPPIIPPTTTCTDSDDGLNYYVQGTVDYEGSSFTDACTYGWEGVFENYCNENGERSEVQYSCPEGSCINGVCSKEHKMVVLLVNFLDSPAQPFTSAEAHNLIFNGQFQNFYQEQSYNRIHFSGDVFGWLTLPRNSINNCHVDLWDGEMDLTIMNNNIDLSNYEHLVIVANGLCPGVSNGGGASSSLGPWPIQINNQLYNLSSAWMGGNFEGLGDLLFSEEDYVLLHEMGHSLGVMHANGWDCNNATLGFDCVHIEYGNWFDMMAAGAYAQHFNALYKEHLGWVLPQETLTITQSGTYTINDLETPGGKKFAKIQLLGSDLFPYYLEYRKGIGFDSSLNDPDLISNQDGLLINQMIHSNYGPRYDFPRLLDMASTTLNWGDDLKEASLSENNVFYDPRTGITISSIINPTDNSITFDVNLQQTNCTREQSQVVMSSNNIYSFNVSSQTYYNAFFTLFNNDYPICAPSDFNVTLEPLPPGFSVPWWFPLAVYDLPPEQEKNNLYVSLETSSTICTGSYPISFTVENLNSGLTTTETIIVDIEGVEPCPPTVAPPEL